ncbi:MAG: glycosyltransferase 87 family protein [Actinomycetota bacterium]
MPARLEVSRRAGVALLTVFVVTRLLGAWLADHPQTYGAPEVKITGDPERYRFWGGALALEGLAPYSEVRIEYPPAALPFLVAPIPWESGGHSYRTGFIVSMLVVDAAGLAGLVVIARRRGSLLGAWSWVVLIPLLGPIAYVRLDLVPAVATIWAIERTTARSWLGAGAALALGALAKLYPALLVPAAWTGAGDRRRLVAGVAGVVLIALLPLLGTLDALWDSVLGYHSERGIQVESTWGLALLLLAKTGRPVTVAYNFGAFHVAADAAGRLEAFADALSVVALGGGTWLTARLVERGHVARLAAALFATLAGTMVVGTVLSPQFLLWLSALAAAALAFKHPSVGPAILLLAPAAALSQALYPFLYNDLLAGDALPLALLGGRNVALGGAAVGTWLALARRSSARGFPRRRVGAPGVRPRSGTS